MRNQVDVFYLQVISGVLDWCQIKLVFVVCLLFELWSWCIRNVNVHAMLVCQPYWATQPIYSQSERSDGVKTQSLSHACHVPSPCLANTPTNQLATKFVIVCSEQTHGVCMLPNIQMASNPLLRAGKGCDEWGYILSHYFHVQTYFLKV